MKHFSIIRFVIFIWLMGSLFGGDFIISPSQIKFDDPNDWEFVSNKLKGTLCQYIEKEQGQLGFNNNLVVTVMEVTNNEAQKIAEIGVLETNIKTQERTFPLYKVLEKTQREINGLKCELLVASYAMGALDVIAYQVFIMQGVRIYNFTFTCKKNDYGRLLGVFEDVVSSIRIVPVEDK